MTIERYVLVDTDDHEQDYEYADPQEAIAEADERGCAVIARHYEYADSELIHTPNGSGTWPPH